jgi:hypothetical protein
MRFTGRKGEMDRQTIGGNDRMNLAGEATA